MMNDEPPFDPPYRTFEQTDEGMRVVETLANGSTRIVPPDEVSQAACRAHLAGPGSFGSTARPSPVSGTARTAAAPPSAQANGRAATFLAVPFAEKDNAKRLGAKWDGAARKWYVPHGIDIQLFSRWWPDSLKREMP